MDKDIFSKLVKDLQLLSNNVNICNNDIENLEELLDNYSKGKINYHDIGNNLKEYIISQQHVNKNIGNILKNIIIYLHNNGK